MLLTAYPARNAGGRRSPCSTWWCAAPGRRLQRKSHHGHPGARVPVPSSRPSTPAAQPAGLRARTRGAAAPAPSCRDAGRAKDLIRALSPTKSRVTANLLSQLLCGSPEWRRGRKRSQQPRPTPGGNLHPSLNPTDQNSMIYLLPKANKSINKYYNCYFTLQQMDVARITRAGAHWSPPPQFLPCWCSL